MSNKGSVEDRLAIRELLDLYADAVNQRDADAWGATWCEDSEWNLTVVPGMESVKGKDAIVKGWVESMKLFPFVHMICSVGTINVEGDRATMRSYTAEVAVLQSGEEIRPRGQYDDELVKIDGKWLFKRRAFKSLHGE